MALRLQAGFTVQPGRGNQSRSGSSLPQSGTPRQRLKGRNSDPSTNLNVVEPVAPKRVQMLRRDVSESNSLLAMDSETLLARCNSAFHKMVNITDITREVLRAVLAYCGADSLFLVRTTMANRKVLEASLDQNKIWSLLQGVPLSSCKLFSRNILLECECSEKALILSNATEVQAVGSDYYHNDSPESLLCLPVYGQQRHLGSLYVTNLDASDAFQQTNIGLLTLLFSNLLNQINQVALKVQVRQVHAKSDVKIANRQAGTLLQDTMMVYNQRDKAWEAQFVTLSSSHLQVFETPFDSNPLQTVSVVRVEEVLVSSCGKNEKILQEELPLFPSKFKAKSSLLLLKIQDRGPLWLGLGSLKTAHSWYQVIQDTLKQKKSLSLEQQYSSLQIPSNIRIAESDIVIGQLIGQGAAASVHRGTWNKTTVVAVKRLYDNFSQMEADNFYHEMAILHSLRHPNIVQLMGGYIGSEDNRPSIVCEYAIRGALEDVLYDPLVGLTSTIKLGILQDIARALSYLHSQSPIIIHRDLKPGNVLISHKWSAKLADFGLARKMDSTMSIGQGTIKWMAPETLSRQEYTEKADIYSLALVMWEIVAQARFFTEFKSNAAIEAAVVNHNARPSFAPSFPAKLKTLIEQCWAANPSERPSAAQISNELNSLNKKDLSAPSKSSRRPKGMTT